MKVSGILRLTVVLCLLLLFGACNDNGSSSSSGLTVYRVSGTHILAPGEELTINGQGFGSTPGEIHLQQGSLSVLCSITSWRDNAVTFEAPEGMEGLCNLVITCPRGEETILSYVHVKEDPEVGDTVGHSCSGYPIGLAYYDGKIWLFQPWSTDSITFYIKYQTYDIAADRWSDCSFLEIDGSEHYTSEGLTKVAPIIVNNFLLVFWFNQKGNATCAMLTGQDQNNHDIWQWVPGTKPDLKGQYYPAPVFNPTTNRVELYYNSGGAMVCYYADVPDPQKPFQLTFQQAHPTTPLPSPRCGPGATIVQTGTDPQTKDPIYQTMLAYADDDKKIHIDYLDGDYNSTRSDILDEKTIETPSLVNLENGLVALLWVGTSNYGDVAYYDWQNPKQGDHGWTGKESWKTWLNHLTAVAAYDPISPGTGADPNYPDMKGQMFCAYACFDNKVHWRIDRGLGTWRYESTQTVDMREGLFNQDNTPGPTFALCPVLGVVDAPPFVYNGEPLDHNHTCLKLVDEQGVGSAFDMSLKGGPYFEAGGEKKPFTMQVSVGASYAYNQDFHQVMAITNGNCAADPAEILLVMLAPVFDFVEYVRYDTNNKKTGDTFTMVTIGDAFLYFLPWSEERPDFDENFPNLYRHKAGCVNSYGQDMSKLPVAYDAGDTWHYVLDNDGEITIRLVTEEKTMNQVGGYAKFKIGGDIKKLFSLGVEGEFDVNWSSTTSVSTETELNLWNPESHVNGDVYSFDVTAYWLEPTEDADWVPAYRQGSGDKPWFITYTVDTPLYVGGIVTPGCE